eukprot:12052004-Alexandrium_andersonii.AAC.1
MLVAGRYQAGVGFAGQKSWNFAWLGVQRGTPQGARSCPKLLQTTSGSIESASHRNWRYRALVESGSSFWTRYAECR